MPLTKTDICNMALGHIGNSAFLSNVDSQQTTAAVVCRQYYEQCRDMLLELREWNFATLTDTLADLDDAPDEWGFRYDYPADCKRVNCIRHPNTRVPATESEKIPYKVQKRSDGEGRVILCDLEDAVLEYNVLVEDETQFTSLFAQALAWCLASHIAIPLKANADIAKNATLMFQAWAMEASSHDGSEYFEAQPDSEFVRARG
jgi:hypothetical protein